jgi:hypothetical protein
MLKHVIYFFSSLILFGCQPNHEINRVDQQNNTAHACGAQWNILNLKEISTLIDPVSRKVFNQIESNSKFCQLINDLAAYKQAMRPGISQIEVLDILQNIANLRQDILDSIPIDIKRTKDQFAIKLGNGSKEIFLDIFLNPTCHECAKLFITDLIPLIDELQKNPLPEITLVINFLPRIKTSLALIDQAIADEALILDDQFALHWLTNIKDQDLKLESLKAWYSLIHQNDPTLRRNMSNYFNKFFKYKKVQLNAKQIIDIFPSYPVIQEKKDTTLIFINGRIWTKPSQFKLNKLNLNMIINHQ